MTDRIITNWTERAEDATIFLAETDVKIAEAKVNHVRSQKIAKNKWSVMFQLGDGSVEARKAQAEISDEHVDAVEQELRDMLEYEKLKNQRETACNVIDFWRSYNKAVQEGHV